MFFFRKPKLVLDCFTESEMVATTAPIEKASMYFPEWWKTIDKQYYQEAGKLMPLPTIKSCPGMVDYYTNSVALPAWCEFNIEVKEDGGYSWQFADLTTEAMAHPYEQYTGLVDPNQFGHLKIVSPWLFRCKEDINWLWSQPTYSFGSSMDLLFILPGMNNYLHNSTININLLVNTQHPKMVTIKMNQPLVNITPMSEKRVEIKRHVVTEQEFIRLDRLNRRSTFISATKQTPKYKEKFKGCPYTGGMK